MTNAWKNIFLIFSVLCSFAVRQFILIKYAAPVVVALLFVDCDNDLLGTPETSFKGLRTLMARRVLRSTISWSSVLPASPGSWFAVKMVMYLSIQLLQNTAKTRATCVAKITSLSCVLFIKATQKQQFFVKPYMNITVM